MKILMISQTADGMGVAQRLVLEGHQVAIWIKNKEYSKSGQGFVERPSSWREKLRWAELVICDMVGMGKYENVLKSIGVPYMCCSDLLDRLELDRGFGMDTFQEVGITIPETWNFGSADEARAMLDGVDFGGGFAIKADGNIGCATSRVIKEPLQLDWAFGEYQKATGICVQRIVSGVEVSTEGWFNGSEFITPFNHTFEEKRLLPGGLGPNTGCMGNVVIGRESNRLTRATVERLAPFLVRAKWRGPIDVNCIVNESGAFALEATCRFGYDAIEAFLEGLSMSAGSFFSEVAGGRITEMALTKEPMIAVRLSVPPYPIEDVPQTEWGEPILGINENNINHLFLCNVFIDPGDKLFKVAPADGVVLKATAVGGRRGDDPLGEARRRVYRTLDNIRLGSKQYRLDIGSRVKKDVEQLVSWGWIQKSEEGFL